MGSHNTKQSQQQSSVVINHQLFRNVQLIRQNNRSLMSIKIPAEDKEYEKWKLSLESMKTASEYLMLPVSHSFNKQGFCSSLGNVNVIYEVYPFVLIDEIQSRKQQRSRFQEDELWFLLYTMSAAQVEMKRVFGTKIGDVKPQNIFLNQDGEIKIACLKSWPGQKSNYSKAIELQQSYLAPQEIEKLESGQIENICSHQSQIFSIGMTILSTALMKDCFFLYELVKMKFSIDKFSSLMEEWKSNQIYSEIFTALVVNLCQIEPQKRLTLQQLWTFLSSYEKYILKKCKFVIKNAPLKIQNTVQFLRNSRVFYKQSFKIQNQQISNRSPKALQKYAPILQPSSSLTQLKNAGVPPFAIQKVEHTPIMTTFNYANFQNRQLLPQNYIVHQNNSSLQQNIQVLVNNNVHVNGSFNTLERKNSPQINEHQKFVGKNHTSYQQKQVHAIMNPQQSIVSQQNDFSPVGSDYVYTRRVINLRTNSLLEQQNIDKNQYIQGIKRKISQEAFSSKE